MCNYNPAFVVGSKDLQVFSYKEHAATNMHKQALFLSKKQSSSDVTEYAPIAKALHNLDGDTALKVKRKFDIAKQNLAFTKMGPLCELEERHGVDLGEGSVFEMHLFHMSGMTGTCQIKLNDVLTLCQSNFEMLSGALV